MDSLWQPVAWQTADGVQPTEQLIRDDVPALVARMRALQAECAALRAQLR